MITHRHNPSFFTVAVLAAMLLMACPLTTTAQLSPGDLTRAHAHLEGIANCTQCHVLGDKVTNAKCLDCHQEIKSRIDERKGYHASREVAGKDCFACHSEHHGRSFEIVRFDTRQFDHRLTGYPLTGAHAQQDCKACHQSDNITSTALRKKEQTYLGLPTDCKACHEDVHRGTLSANCASCHTTISFAPATGFDHSETDFPLRGRHKQVDCRQCHEVTMTDETPFQRFSGVPFSSCASCHDDLHNNRLGSDCKSCHTEESFQQFVGKNNYNHNQTAFPLVGQHRRVDCASCHTLGSAVNATTVFADYAGKDFNNCASCHDDVHETRFGEDCRSCHTEETFQRLLHPERFDHALTGFALEGKHQAVDCRQCHETRMIDPVAHQQCADCHNDFHEGQFIRNAYRPDCRDCHTTAGFSESSYTIDMHNAGPFPLTGAHLATPCFACHLQEEQWVFRDLGSSCVDCHTDIHDGYLSEKYYPDKACTHCHTTDTWSRVVFDHTLTNFDLQGKHMSTACVSCHLPDDRTTIENRIVFTGQDPNCNACHDNIHGPQFEIEGQTDCQRCHTFEGWSPTTFDHNTARFVLKGAHLQVECSACHKPDIPEDKATVIYRIERFECIDCHL